MPGGAQFTSLTFWSDLRNSGTDPLLLKAFGVGPMPPALISVQMTFVTSVWIILISLAISAFKLIPALQRFVWFFDAERRPLHAIGVLAGVILILWGALWSWLADIL